MAGRAPDGPGGGGMEAAGPEGVPRGEKGLQILVDGGSRPAWVPRVEAAARAALRTEGVEEGEISVALLDDEDIRRLNRDHLDHDRVTDVISFALWDEGEPVLGDIYIGVEQAMRQAAEAGVSPEEEVDRLVVHGCLHVLGWDHPEDAAARMSSPMYLRQEEILRELAAGGEASRG